MNLSIDCNKMLKPKAIRKAPLKKAPSTLALCQPKAKLAGASVRSDSYAEYQQVLDMSWSGRNDLCGNQSYRKGDQVVELL